MIKPSSHPVLSIYINDIEYFEEYWDTTKGPLWQTHIESHLDAAPTKPKGKSYNENKFLHWVL